MARPRTASNILDARGAFRKNPQRARPNEPKVTDPIADHAPAHLDEAEQGCWRELRDQIPAGVLTAADSATLEVVAVLFARFRKDKSDMSAAHLTRMTAMMGRLGLDPSGRASLTVDGKKKNDFDDF